MKQLQFRIFHPIDPVEKNLTPSQKIDRISYYLLIPLFICFLVIINSRSQPQVFNYLAITVFFLLFIVRVIGEIKRIGEYENLNGYFDGNLQFENYDIYLGNNKIPLNEILELEIFYFDFSGRKTDNRRSGPQYTNGIGNKISIKTIAHTFECYFEINTEADIYRIETYPYTIVVNKRIPLTKNHLELVPNDFRDSKAYQELLTI